ncbi:MAG: membrane protein insertase YidC [Phycisphaerales bacterium]|nr:membrane protein insertase YidC [Phycisphaerales bacterium]
MADGPKSRARFLIPMVMAGLVVTVGFLLFGKKATPVVTQPPTPAVGAAQASAPPAPPGGTAGAAERGYTGPLQAVMQKAEAWLPLGSLQGEGKSDPLMQVKFQQEGAGVLELALARHHQETDKKSANVVLQETRTMSYGPGAEQRLVPFALLQVEIDGQPVKLAGTYRDSKGDPVAYDWKQASPGVFVAEIADSTGKTVARVSRTYRLVDDLYEVTLEQSFENLTDKPMAVRFSQLGPVELPIGIIRYGGDPRRVRLGILANPTVDPTGKAVEGQSPLLTRDDVLGKAAIASGTWVWPDITVWPTPKAAAENKSLAWIGVTNRFFTVTVHSLAARQPARTDLPTPTPMPDIRLHSWETIDRVVLTREPDSSGVIETNAAVALRGLSPVMAVPAGGSVHADLGIYAGPIDRGTLKAANAYSGGIKLTDIEIYFWPGPCSFCTFQFLAHGLRFVMTFFADHVVFDWALAIILLVICVRTVLHPITKWSQTSLQRFGKQMQRVGPKQKLLQEKFKDDPARLRQEVANLMREENINYAQALGCLPMLMQTPIWIALSSLMFFLFDLRHMPAFFGAFQKLTGGAWHFLSDLAEPDHFITLPFGFDVPLMGHIDSLNMLPVVLGLVFYGQQKYLTPPPTAQLSPEMETQQKIMKVVIVFLFPLMMYNAPSGLALYFITNSALGIVESRHIRKEFEKSELAREEVLKKNPHAFSRKDKNPGFFARLQARFAEAQSRAEQLKRQQQQQGKDKYGPKR